MKNLTPTQEFTLCALDEKGNLSNLKQVEISVCLLASMFYEMLEAKNIAFNEKKKLIALSQPDTSKLYLTFLYQKIQKKPISVSNLSETYIFSITKNFEEEILSPLLDELAAIDTLEIQKQDGFLGTKSLYIPDTKTVNTIIEKVRAEFLEDGSISDETLVLGVLLQHSGLLKRYFSKYENDKLKERIKDLNQSEIYSLVKKLLDEIILIISVISIL